MAQGAVKQLIHTPNSVKFWIQDVFAPSSHSSLNVLQSLWTFTPLPGAPNQFKSWVQTLLWVWMSTPSPSQTSGKSPAFCSTQPKPGTVLSLLQHSLRGPANPGRTGSSLPSPEPLPSFPQPRESTTASFLKPASWDKEKGEPCYYYKWMIQKN